MFAYIKEWKLVYTSNDKFSKYQELITEEVTKTREIEVENVLSDGTKEIVLEEQEYTETVVIQPLIEWMVYDEVIETDIEWRVCFENWEIVAWEESEEKAQEDAKSLSELQEKEAELKKTRPGEIKKQLWELIIQKNWMIELWEDTTEVEAMIEALKLEYAAL